MIHKPALPVDSGASTLHGRRAIVRRARIERLAMELLRLADAARLPVPVDTLWHSPPPGLWPPPSTSQQTLVEDTDNPYLTRFITAREIAAFVNQSDRGIKEQLLGSTPMDDEERTLFAIALLMPTALLATLSRRQLMPDRVAHIFQVPAALAEQRLRELDYL